MSRKTRYHYTWGVKSRDGFDLVYLYNMTRDEAERVVAAAPKEFRVAAISTKRCKPVSTPKYIPEGEILMEHLL
jgi:hypothetical protein